VKAAVLRAGLIASDEVREPLCAMSEANALILAKALTALGK
jgi:dihydrodipicolinate synthase/N-acetylneuraminate lyase